MSDWNSFAETLDAARAQGRREGRREVLAIVRRVLPTTEADHIESRVLATTLVALPDAIAGSSGPLAVAWQRAIPTDGNSGSATSAAARTQQPSQDGQAG